MDGQQAIGFGRVCFLYHRPWLETQASEDSGQPENALRMARTRVVIET
jgi:hypothetical protein